MSSTQEAINKARCAETFDIWSEKAREYERLTRAKEVADIIRAYCPNGGTVSYDDLCDRYRKLMEKVIH
jgi:hypothetical protein